MTLKEISKRFDGLRVKKIRNISDDYQERVIYNKDIDEWHAMLTELLGAPAKPAGAVPSAKDLALCAPYGSIYENQVLFSKEFEEGVIVAMFWPWSDDKYTTFKIGIVANKDALGSGG